MQRNVTWYAFSFAAISFGTTPPICMGWPWGPLTYPFPPKGAQAMIDG